MAASLNKVTLIGCLGKDPEIKTFANGGRVANFSVATSESWKDKATGEKKERTEWHRIAVFNDHLVGVVEQYLKKGQLVYIEGKLETRKWQDKDGAEKYTTEITLRPYAGELKMLGKKEGGGSASSRPAQEYEDGGDTSALHKSAAAERDAKGSTVGGDLDDEIPF